MFTILVSCINSIHNHQKTVKIILTLLLHESIIENKIDTMFKLKNVLGIDKLKPEVLKYIICIIVCIEGDSIS